MAEGQGRQFNQKMKPYLVLRYLMDNSDKDHVVPEREIEEWLKDEKGITADKRSIYSDIKAINEALYAYQNEVSIQEAHDDLEECEEEKYIVYSPSQKGYYFQHRLCDEEDIMLMYQCVSSASFLDKGKAEDIFEEIGTLLYGRQALLYKKIAKNYVSKPKVKTTNKDTIFNFSIINDAMSRRVDGYQHTPSKISFKYLHYDISNINTPKESVETYTVSPYHIYYDANTCHYYLLAFFPKKNPDGLTTFRIDRMKRTSELKEPREKEEQFGKIDWDLYVEEMTNGFSGQKVPLTLDCANKLLDTMIEKFGTKGTKFYPKDEKRFTVRAEIQVNQQFYSWICGFGDKVVIREPQEVADDFKKYLKKIEKQY